MTPWFVVACATGPAAPPPPEPLAYEPLGAVPAAMQVTLPPQSSLAALTALAAPLGTRPVEVDDAEALAAQPVNLVAPGPVAPQALWLAWQLALELSGWSVREGAVDRVVRTGPPWSGEGVLRIEVRHVDGTSVVALERWLDRSLPEGARVEVDPASNTVVYGGGADDLFGSLRDHVDRALELRLTDDGGLTLCAGSVPPAVPVWRRSGPDAGKSVTMNFPPSSSLATMASFFCDLGRVPMIVADYDALEADTVSLADIGTLSPAEAWAVFRTALAVRGWTLDPADGGFRLVHGSPVVASSAPARVAVVHAPGSAKKLATPTLLAEPLGGGRVVVAGSDDAVVAALAAR